jgi:hypothetical protein
MHTHHPVFIEPQDTSVFIWRYMDFTKFAAMLDRAALFFSRADMLNDSFEGVFPKPNLANHRNPLQELKTLRQEMFINSWHVSDYESAAMWKLFTNGGEGVAIRSRFCDFSASLSREELYAIHIGLVSYVDYETAMIPEGDPFYPFLHKRKSFEYEHELRAIIHRPGTMTGENGKSIAASCDLDVLIDSIFVSPAAPGWFRDLVSSLCRKYGIEKPVHQSRLAESPLY